jgi:hypothetical protein
VVDLGGTRESIAAAVASHRSRVASAVGRHGSVSRFASVGQVLAFDAEYRQRICPTVLWVPTRRALMQGVLVVVLGILLAAWAVMSLLGAPR